MKTVTLNMSEAELREIYKSAGPEMKAKIEKEFGPEIFKGDAKERVRFFEDACRELGIVKESKPDRDKEPYARHVVMYPMPIVSCVPERLRKSLLAYYKLMVITEALNEGWIPDFTDATQKKYWIYMWHSDNGAACGLASASSLYAWSFSYTIVGARLVLKDRETAEYAITKFKSLYEDFLRYDDGRTENKG
jgi:hypothetical protein